VLIHRGLPAAAGDDKLAMKIPMAVKLMFIDIKQLSTT
jgi:hypothetical protein